MKNSFWLWLWLWFFIVSMCVSITSDIVEKFINSSDVDFKKKYTQATNECERLHIKLQEHSAEIAHLEWVIERLHKDSTGEEL